MTTKVKKLKALLGFQGTSDPDLLKQLHKVHDGMDGNTAFPIPPIDMTMFKSGIDLFNTLVTDAEDGGKKAISAKNRQREVMIKQVTLLGHYVEMASNDDLATFNTSGFVAAPTTRSVPEPLPPASFEWIDRGPATGEIVVKVKGLPKAISYDVQNSLVASAGAPPMAGWTEVKRSWPMPRSQCSVLKKRMLISGGASSMCDIRNLLKLFSTMCPSWIVFAWCMASL